MNVLVFTDHFHPEPSAPAAHIFERARIWVREGHQVTVVTSAPNFPEGKLYPGYRNAWRTVEELDGIRVVRVKTYLTGNQGTVRRSLDFLSYLPSAIWQARREPRPDVVFASSPHLFVPVAGAVLARWWRVPLVTEIRDLWPESLEAVAVRAAPLLMAPLRVLEGWIYRHSDHLIAITDGIRERLSGRSDVRVPVTCVPNGANLELFTPRPPDEGVQGRYALADRFVVGYLGTIGAAHDLGNAVEAFARLPASEAVLLIGGAGAARAGLEAMVATRGIPNVRFAPRLPKAEVPAHWSVCHASLVHLRDAEVFRTALPSKVFESMAMGLPIIYVGPDSPGAALVRERGTGVVVPPGRPELLAEAIQSLAADRTRLAECAARSLAAAPEFSRDVHAARTMQVFRQATGRAA